MADKRHTESLELVIFHNNSNLLAVYQLILVRISKARINRTRSVVYAFGQDFAAYLV